MRASSPLFTQPALTIIHAVAPVSDPPPTPALTIIHAVARLLIPHRPLQIEQFGISLNANGSCYYGMQIEAVQVSRSEESRCEWTRW